MPNSVYTVLHASELTKALERATQSLMIDTKFIKHIELLLFLSSSFVNLFPKLLKQRKNVSVIIETFSKYKAHLTEPVTIDMLLHGSSFNKFDTRSATCLACYPNLVADIKPKLYKSFKVMLNTNYMKHQALHNLAFLLASGVSEDVLREDVTELEYHAKSNATSKMPMLLVFSVAYGIVNPKLMYPLLQGNLYPLISSQSQYKIYLFVVCKYIIASRDIDEIISMWYKFVPLCIEQSFCEPMIKEIVTIVSQRVSHAQFQALLGQLDEKCSAFLKHALYFETGFTRIMLNYADVQFDF